MDIELVFVEPLGFKIEDRYQKEQVLIIGHGLNTSVASWEVAFEDVKSPWFFTVYSTLIY